MKKIMFAWDIFGVSKNSVIFRVVACGVFVAIVLCGGCSNNGIGTVVGEGKVPSSPSAPSDVSAKARSSDSVEVSWLSVSQTKGYNVYRSTIRDTGYTKVGGTKSTEYYTNTGLSSGTIYYYKVAAYNDGGESPLSSHTSVTTIPGIPLNVTATAVSSSDITVRWSSVYGATGYNLFRWAKTNKSDILARATSDTSYKDIGLSPGTIYYYTISAYNSSGEGVQSAPVSTMSPPNPPSNVTATATPDGNITVSWSSVKDVTGYTVYRDTNAYGEYNAKIYTTTDTLYTNTGLLSGTTYYYKISAHNSGGTSQLSSNASAMTVPAVPSNISLVATSTNSITVRWSSVNGATGYKVYRGMSDDDRYDTVYTVRSTSCIDSVLSSGTTYYYKISAYNSGGEGLKSQTAQMATIPDVPFDVLATETHDGKVIVSWSSVYGATGYKVYRGTDDDDYYDTVYTVNSTSYTDVVLIFDTTYYYRVSAVNIGGESSLSDYVSAMPERESVFGTFYDERDGTR